MNQVILMGHLTKDPERRATNTGKAIAGFTVAVNRPGKDSGADFISCIAFEKTADMILNYFHKGNRILLTGHISVRTYEDKTGQKRTSTDVIVDRFEFCESKQTGAQTIEKNQEMTPIDDADLPF